ncbi:MAG TPA: hypothetical protein VHV99_18200 [Paraburkholderia sp.]|nr:hypothetical protein [Paraburkholderia sp.]
MQLARAWHGDAARSVASQRMRDELRRGHADDSVCVSSRVIGLQAVCVIRCLGVDAVTHTRQ